MVQLFRLANYCDLPGWMFMAEAFSFWEKHGDLEQHIYHDLDQDAWLTWQSNAIIR